MVRPGLLPETHSGGVLKKKKGEPRIIPERGILKRGDPGGKGVFMSFHTGGRSKKQLLGDQSRTGPLNAELRAGTRKKTRDFSPTISRFRLKGRLPQ